jgi:hypothetical protein
MNRAANTLLSCVLMFLYSTRTRNIYEAWAIADTEA